PHSTTPDPPSTTPRPPHADLSDPEAAAEEYAHGYRSRAPIDVLADLVADLDELQPMFARPQSAATHTRMCHIAGQMAGVTVLDLDLRAATWLWAGRHCVRPGHSRGHEELRTNPTEDRFTGERFDKALNATLNSVVFRSSGQELTTTGAYIEMASRVTEPVLLGLALLAVRNRIKR
ncbi:hypothetical protein ACFRLW_41750, partial [Streptomyces sp. NPDC056728]